MRQVRRQDPKTFWAGCVTTARVLLDLHEKEPCLVPEYEHARELVALRVHSSGELLMSLDVCARGADLAPAAACACARA